MNNNQKNPTIYINARCLTQPLSGMQRYTEELITALDILLSNNPDIFSGAKIIALCPRGRKRTPPWKNIHIKEIGKLKSHAWDQFTLYLASRKGILVSLTGYAPMFHKQNILTLHDANIFVNPQYFSRAYRILHRFIRPIIAKRAKKLITISEFSKNELSKHCSVPPEKFSIIPNSAEHILKTPPDTSILAKHNLAPKKYFLCVGNLSPNKNIGLVLDAFQSIDTNDFKLAIAGSQNKIFSKTNDFNSEKALFLGRVSDGELNALYQHAAAFIFPSFYEGFGIPPLEAMTLGCPVISSNAAAMPEVLGDAAIFFNPHSKESCAKSIQKFLTIAASDDDLSKHAKKQADLYRWSLSANLLVSLIQEVLHETA